MEKPKCNAFPNVDILLKSFLMSYLYTVQHGVALKQGGDKCINVLQPLMEEPGFTTRWAWVSNGTGSLETKF